MKKILFIVLSACTISFITGCTGLQTPVGYSMATPAGIYTNMTFPSAIQENSIDSKDFEVLRITKGESRTTNILCVAAFGDGGINMAVKDALDNVKGADDLINMKVDTRMFSILGLFTTATTKVKGIAIKYKNLKE